MAFLPELFTTVWVYVVPKLNPDLIVITAVESSEASTEPLEVVTLTSPLHTVVSAIGIGLIIWSNTKQKRAYSSESRVKNSSSDIYWESYSIASISSMVALRVLPSAIAMAHMMS